SGYIKFHEKKDALLRRGEQMKNTTRIFGWRYRHSANQNFQAHQRYAVVGSIITPSKILKICLLFWKQLQSRLKMRDGKKGRISLNT
ncbi:hypothetical protein MUO79_11095, partial [Candidatus Bathyarchaeota archaeon]|nr:hypothetical protein [Candidatus Bathyarchaeota archaeon]